jgi:hypothetical protein
MMDNNMDTGNTLLEKQVDATGPKPNSISDVVNQLGLFVAAENYQDTVHEKLSRAGQMFDITRDAGSVQLLPNEDGTFQILISDPGRSSIELNKTFGMQTIKSIDLDNSMSFQVHVSSDRLHMSDLHGAQIKAILLGQNVSLNLKTIILEPDGDGWTKIKLQVAFAATPNHLIDFTIPQKRAK